MTRKPFLSLISIAGLSLALMLALALVAVPAPAQARLQRCIDAVGACRSLLLTLRAAGTPVLLVVLLAHLGWSAQRSLREGRRQWRATRGPGPPGVLLLIALLASRQPAPPPGPPPSPQGSPPVGAPPAPGGVPGP